jgi:putative membrane-bound dehydrogenase-like protein
MAPGAEPAVKPEDLPRVPATEPKDAIKTFKVRPGFHVEIVAAEPLVVDPIAMSFDEDGRMFVVEMRDYSERRAEALGRIRMLEDTDGDGTYDKSTVFLDHLAWPTAVTCTRGGILVGACPDIIFAKDTDGDGVADEKKVLFTGFGSTQEKLNVQGLFNNFIWGIDNRIHGCSGHDGGMVKRVTSNESPAAPPRESLDVRNKGFIIDPRDWSMVTESGGGQYGLSFDHTGRLFTCSNSVHIETFMYDARYAARNPLVTLPDPRVCIAADGPAAEVYRISPEEPWRVIRTRWRVAGLVGGPIEGGGRSAGYFTGATGITIYKGDAFDSSYVGDAFIGDAGGNLVHHKKVRPGLDGIEPVAERPVDEKKIEFCASTDNWFRPVDFANTPDGTLYVADMYRETIEHPWSLPPQIKQYLDLNSGNDRGRIYRLAPDKFKPRRPPRFSDAGTANLVAALEHPNGWHRETASRLLFERQDKSAVAPLGTLLEKSQFPLARMHALHALAGLNALTDLQIIAAMRDDDPIVREHAIALSEILLPVASNKLLETLTSMADDPSPRVRYQLALTAGAMPVEPRTTLLAKLIRHDVDSKWMQAAVLSSLNEGADAVLVELVADSAFRKAGAAFLRSLAGIVTARNSTDAVDRVLSAVSSNDDASASFSLAAGLAEGAARSPDALKALRPRLKPLFDRAAELLQHDRKSSAAPDAAALLGYAEYAQVAAALYPLLGGNGMQTLQTTALSALDQFDNAEIAARLVEVFAKLSPRVRDQAIAMLVKRPDRAMVLLDAVRDGKIARDAVGSVQRTSLYKQPDSAVAKLAKELLPPPTTQRTQVVEAFRPALTMTGDASHGRRIYEARCISCHRAEGVGNTVGPDFTTVRNAGKEKLLLNIVDPSREVAANYIAYLVETKTGDSILGILASDTPTSITLRQAYGRESVIPRANIKRMTSQGKSLMPDGLEEALKPQEMADLIQFVETAK